MLLWVTTRLGFSVKLVSGKVLLPDSHEKNEACMHHKPLFIQKCPLKKVPCYHKAKEILRWMKHLGPEYVLQQVPTHYTCVAYDG